MVAVGVHGVCKGVVVHDIVLYPDIDFGAEVHRVLSLVRIDAVDVVVLVSEVHGWVVIV